MPHFKSRRRRRHSRPKKGMVKLIKKVITQQSEQKFREDTQSNSSIGGGGMIRNMTTIGQGLNFGDRVGIEIQPDLLNFRFHLFLNSNPGIPISARVFVIQNLVDQDPTNLPTDVVTLMPNLQQSSVPYRILYDRTFDMSLGSGFQDINRQVRIRGSKLKSIKWVGSDANIYTQGQIRFYIVTDNEISDLLENVLNYRLVFHDN